MNFAGVELSQQAAQLFSEVEALYHKPIRLRAATKDDKPSEVNMFAASNVTEDGIPEVLFFPSHALSEEFIVHELFHLKYPSFWIDFKLMDLEPDFDFSVFGQLQACLLDPILHQNFFQDMRVMGFVPDRSLREHLIHTLSGASLDEVPQLKKEWYRPLYYFATALETADAALINQIEDYYDGHAWHKELSMGKDLVKAGLGAKPTLEGITNAIVECLTVYYKDKITFGSYNTSVRAKAGKVDIFKITLFAHPKVA